MSIYSVNPILANYAHQRVKFIDRDSPDAEKFRHHEEPKEMSVEERVSRALLRSNSGEESISLSEQEIEELKLRGYELLQKLGEGMTREAYLASQKIGDGTKLRVVKIPKSEFDETSLQTHVSRTKGDVNKRETDISNHIQHANIVEVIDSFYLNGRTINVEAYHEGSDLETIVKQTGQFRDEGKFEEVFTQFLRGAVYLEKEGILHRDYKPSNLLLTRRGVVMISDLQTAADRWNVDSKTLPTRGGTAFTHIDLLNDFVDGRNSRATQKTEIYGIGATLYYLLTGRNAFNYKIVESEDGKEVVIGDKTLKVKLQDGNEDIESITNETHEINLKRALIQIPKKYQDLIGRCLTTDFRRSIHSVRFLQGEFEKIKGENYKGFFRKLGERILDKEGLRYAIPVAVALGVGSLFTLGYTKIPNPGPRSPSFSETLAWEDYKRFNLESLCEIDLGEAIKEVEPYLRSAAEKMSGKRPESNFYGFIKNITDARKIPQRFSSAWLNACRLNQDRLEDYNKNGEERLSFTFVPKKYFMKNYSLSPTAEESITDEGSLVAFGSDFLKECYEDGKDVADVYASYFSTRQQIFEAMKQAEGINYFSIMRDGKVQKGYGEFLPKHQRELINTAIGLYMITNEEGVAHWPIMGEFEEYIRSRRSGK